MADRLKCMTNRISVTGSDGYELFAPCWLIHGPIGSGRHDTARIQRTPSPHRLCASARGEMGGYPYGLRAWSGTRCRAIHRRRRTCPTASTPFHRSIRTPPSHPRPADTRPRAEVVVQRNHLDQQLTLGADQDASSGHRLASRNERATQPLRSHSSSRGATYPALLIVSRSRVRGENHAPG